MNLYIYYNIFTIKKMSNKQIYLIMRYIFFIVVIDSIVITVLRNIIETN